YFIIKYINCNCVGEKMLHLCSKNEFDKYADFIYELAADLTKSGYPTYCDGIKTKVKFVERSFKAFERDTEHMLLFEYEGEVQGMIHYFWIPEDHYLQTICFNISKATKQAISEFLAYVGERFKGYDVLLGFPAENNSAVNFLAEQGFECIENDYKFVKCSVVRCKAQKWQIYDLLL
ncbi:MAG: hypothetical protein K2G51_13870, partial [Lachnospiraceae bacterium]|nr:hypothetical protein [Lachnospiraceae bacterium]